MRVIEFREGLRPMLAMGYFPLSNILNTEVSKEDMRITTLGQILDGLRDLHKHGVVHRDLKANILVAHKLDLRFAIGDL